MELDVILYKTTLNLKYRESVTSLRDLIWNLFLRTFFIPMANYVHVFSHCLKFVLNITENMHDMYDNLNGVVTLIIIITLLLIK